MSGGAFSNNYVSAGAGATYQFLTMGTEDDLFYEGATYTAWKQVWSKYTPHAAAEVIQQFQNVGFGQLCVCNLNKTPDMLYSSYVMQNYPAIMPNTAVGVEYASWVNAPALYAIQTITLTIGSQVIFNADGVTMLVLCELMGLLEHYAPSIGYNLTKNQLIADSQRNRNLYAPFVGFPFQDRPDLAFPIGTIAFHTVSLNLQTRSLTNMVVNYGGVAASTGLYALPIQVSTNSVVSNTSVAMALATTCVWLSQAERLDLVQGYNEIIFKQLVNAATYTVPVSTTSQKLAINLTIKGPVLYFWIIIQSQNDLNNGTWTKCCQDTGEDWITQMMIITDGTAREDGMPADTYRTLKIVESFKTSIRRHVYVLAFETDDTNPQMTGHDNFTNVNVAQFSALYCPNPYPLNVTINAVVYNGAWTQNGTGGVIWG